MSGNLSIFLISFSPPLGIFLLEAITQAAFSPLVHCGHPIVYIHIAFAFLLLGNPAFYIQLLYT